MTLLELVTAFCELQSLPVPTTVTGSTEGQVLQLKRLVQKSCEDLSQRGTWEQLTFEATHTTLAQENQGTLASIVGTAPGGLRWILPETLYDRTRKLPLVGPTSAREWQYRKAATVNGPEYCFRIRNSSLLVNPVPPAGLTWAFEYVTEKFVYTASGLYQKVFTGDADTILLPDQVLQADLEWRWLKKKGLPYEEEFNGAERLIQNAIGRAGMKPILRMDSDTQRGPRPGVFIPAGDWI